MPGNAFASASALAVAVLTCAAAAAGLTFSASVRNHACRRSLVMVAVADALTLTVGTDGAAAGTCASAQEAARENATARAPAPTCRWVVSKVVAVIACSLHAR